MSGGRGITSKTPEAVKGVVKKQRPKKGGEIKENIAFR